MRSTLNRALLFAAPAAICTVLLFQNCGPAQVTGGGDNVSMASLEPTVGGKVDLATLLKSPQEPASNVLYPNSGQLVFDYSHLAPVLETVVFKKNNFDRIEWIHGPTATVVANGDTLSRKQFSRDMVGTYYIVGYRGKSSFLIKDFQITERVNPPVAPDVANAILITQNQVETDASTETVMISADAPDVDVNKISFLQKNTNSTASDKRAILITKKLTEAVDVDVTITDVSGKAVTKTITLTVKACDFGGNAILNGTSTTAFLTASVPFGQGCTSQSRTCSNGFLDGTYTNRTCAVSPPSPCSFNGATIAHGGTVNAYATSTVPYGQTCVAQGRTCNNGILSGTNSFSSCAALPPVNLVHAMAPANLTTTRGAKFSVTLLFTNLKATPTSLLGFAHLVSTASNTTGVAVDFEPRTPSNQWITSSNLTASITMTVPATLAPGTYTIRTGFYERTSPFTRLKLDAGPGITEDSVVRYIVGTVTVQ